MPLLILILLILLLVPCSAKADPFVHVKRADKGAIWDHYPARSHGRSVPSPSEPPPVVPEPARGFNFGHTACPLAGNGILSRYHLIGTRTLVQQILARKRAEGYTWIRHMVWWDATVADPPSSWGPVPVGLPEPYASNLRLFLTDARDAGFRVEIAMGPVGALYPNQVGLPALEPNLSMIQIIRSIAESVDERTTYDLENEGGADPSEVGLIAYVNALWARTAWPDATISFHSGRWRSLVANGILPSVWEVHVYTNRGAPYDVPNDGRPVRIGEIFRDEAPPAGIDYAYWPLLSTPDTDGDANCSTAATP